jgi:hypothetical protein
MDQGFASGRERRGEYPENRHNPASGWESGGVPGCLIANMVAGRSMGWLPDLPFRPPAEDHDPEPARRARGGKNLNAIKSAGEPPAL